MNYIHGATTLEARSHPPELAQVVPDYLLERALNAALQSSEDRSTEEILKTAQAYYSFITSVKVPVNF